MDKIIRSPVFIFLLILAIVTAGVAILLVRSRLHDSGGPMSSAERAQELAKQGLREQIVSFGSGLFPLPDAAQAGEKEEAVNLFAVPVGQITLAEPESRPRMSDAQGNFRGFSGGRYHPMYDSPSSSGVYGSFNNVLIFDKRSGAVTKIFGSRTAIHMFKHINGTTPRVIAFVGTAVDSDKDGRLSRGDMQQLFIYTFDDAKLRMVTGIDASVDDIEAVNGVDYLVVSGTVDRNKNGTPERHSYGGGLAEPTRLYRVDLKSFVAVPLVDAAVVEDLQSTLDGVKGTAP
jgi:hypothetical protein